MSIPLNHRCASILLSLAGGVGFAHATDSAVVSHPCAPVSDATERLACYDNAFPRPSDSAAKPLTDAAARVDALKEFGLSKEQMRQREPERMREITPERIEARVADVVYRPNRERVITLDNGQVWLLTEATSKGHLSAGDAVVVRRAALGSFMLITPSRIPLRARRVE